MDQRIINAGRRPGIEKIILEVMLRNPKLSELEATVEAKSIWIQRNLPSKGTKQ